MPAWIIPDLIVGAADNDDMPTVAPKTGGAQPCHPRDAEKTLEKIWLALTRNEEKPEGN